MQCYHCNDTFPRAEPTNDYPNCVYPDEKKEVDKFGQLISCDEPKTLGNENNKEKLHPLCMIVTLKIGKFSCDREKRHVQIYINKTIW